MSATSDYYYYYSQTPRSYPADPSRPQQQQQHQPQQLQQQQQQQQQPQHWSSWALEQQRFYQQGFAQSVNPPLPPSHHTPPVNYSNETNSLRRPYHTSNASNNGRYYHHQQYQQRRGISTRNWVSKNPAIRKRTRFDVNDTSEPQAKLPRKKKKPLSQNTPVRSWTIEEAKQALAIEKEYNKMFKNPSLIIKFPDLEVNKDIVSKFHPAIENVHFQQPSTARFCFVTIKESVNPDEIINALNKHKFGDGYLTAEYKKDREDDQNVSPEDIDPLTLYVGNLSQDVTKEDVMQMYPNVRRIDIGFAKKMKYTRYAFVCFKNVTDSIEAFKRTHSRQMHSKSLIVRFRRLNGTVGMPGESKPQNPPRNRNDDTVPNAQSNGLNTNANESTSSIQSANSDTNDAPKVDLGLVKQEPGFDTKVSIKKEFITPFLAGSAEQLFAKHRPIKEELKEYRSDDEYDSSIANNIKQEKVYVKTEPPDDSFDDDSEEEESDDELHMPPANFQGYLDSMVSLKNNLSALRKINP